MKHLFFFLISILSTPCISFAQDRAIARGAEPGELYLTTFWYGIYGQSGPPYYDTLRLAVYRISNHGQNVTIQYDVDYFADLYTLPGSVMQPWYILADATPGVLYAVRKYSKDYYQHTQLWKSFDYGKNWAFSEENRGDKNYISAIVNGLIYRAGTDGTYKSDDYAITFMQIHNQKFNIKEHGLKNCEFMFIDINNFYHSSDCYENYFSLTIGEEYVSGGMSGFFPDVYRGATEGEVFVHSWFPWYIYKVSFSDDIGNTFRHVYVNEDYQWQHSLFDKNQMLFMSDRESGVFYILNLLQVEDVNPNGCHLKLCVHYYRDYGETLVDIYCHDINKDYARETCETVTDLTSEKPDNHSVFLTWTEPESDLTIEGYRIFKNHKVLTEQMINEHPQYKNCSKNIIEYVDSITMVKLVELLEKYPEYKNPLSVDGVASWVIGRHIFTGYPEFWLTYFESIEREALLKGNGLTPTEYSRTYDRCIITSGKEKYTYYGEWDDDGKAINPDKELVNKRRANLGLPPLGEKKDDNQFFFITY